MSKSQPRCPRCKKPSMIVSMFGSACADCHYEATTEEASKLLNGEPVVHDLSLVLLDTLKAHAIAIVTNAHSEMTPEQFDEFVNELTPAYVKAIKAHLEHLIHEQRQDELNMAFLRLTTTKPYKDMLGNDGRLAVLRYEDKRSKELKREEDKV